MTEQAKSDVPLPTSRETVVVLLYFATTGEAREFLEATKCLLHHTKVGIRLPKVKEHEKAT